MNPEKAMDPLTLIESVLKDNFDLIRHADHKAQSLLRVNLAIFAAAFIGVPPTIMALKDFVNDGGWKFALFGGIVVLYIICATCLLTSILKIISVIRPRKAANEASELLFHSIARSSLDEFRAVIHQFDHDRVVDARTRQVFQSAVIAQQKYDELNRAITWMLGGGLMGVLFALILLVSAGLV